MGDVLAVGLAVLLLAGNAFFVGAEFSLITARRDRLDTLATQGKARARIVITAGENLSLMLAGAQLGITICSIILGRVGEPAVAHLIEAPMAAVGVPEGLLHPIAFTLALAVVVVLHILLGEMVPKNIAIAGPETSAMLLVTVHVAFVKLVRPLIAVYNWVANRILHVGGVEVRDELETAYSTRELAGMIADSRSEGLIDAGEHRRLTQALRTTGRTVAEVVIPLADVRSLPTHDGGVRLGDLEDAVGETGFSRYPVRTDDGSLLGYLHVKDVLGEVLDDDTGPDTLIGRSQVRTLPTVPAAVPLDEALGTLRRASSHLAAVLDTAGRTVGVVALEDLVEEFVGTVRDATHRAPDPVPGRGRR
ncbi:hemolysin family protein [Rhodococcus aerolatus]